MTPQSSHHPCATMVVLAEAVRPWTFFPAHNAAGQPVLTVMQVPIVFTLNDWAIRSQQRVTWPIANNQ